MLTKLHMVILMQSDLPAAVAFYNKLGLKQAFYISSKWAEFQLGETKIGLCPVYAKASSGLQPLPKEVIPTRTGLVLETTDLAQFMLDLQGECEFLGEPIEKPHGIMVSIKDPGGNIIDIYQPTPEKLKEYLDSQAKEAANEGCCGRRPEEADAKTGKKTGCKDKKASEGAC